MNLTERLKTALKSPRPQIRRDALFVIGRHNLRELSGEILDLFRQERDGSIKGNCAWALGRLLYQEAFDDLIDGLHSKDEPVRIWSAWALGELGNWKAMAPLIEAQRKEYNSNVRRVIGGALKKLRLEGTRVYKKQVLKELQPPSSNDRDIMTIVERLETLSWEEDRHEIIALREQILERDPVYFKVYMGWLKKRPALEAALNNKRRVYSDNE